MKTRETTSMEASTFMVDLRQVFIATKYASQRSLVLLDEFGKGTQISDGVGILASVLDYFASNDECPRILLTTHYHDLVSSGEELLGPTVRAVSTFKQMQVMTQQNSTTGNEILFLYKIDDGLCTDSLGCYCARMAGVDEAVVTRAENITASIIKHQPIDQVIECPSEEWANDKLQELRDLKIEDDEAIMAFLSSLNQ
eukprot:Partr_v1_DN28292_c2_g1_i1_m75974 putative Mismatch repair protein